MWATNNIKGYKSRAGKLTSIALTKEHHAITKAVYRDWLFEKTGKKQEGKFIGKIYHQEKYNNYQRECLMQQMYKYQ